MYNTLTFTLHWFKSCFRTVSLLWQVNPCFLTYFSALQWQVASNEQKTPQKTCCWQETSEGFFECWVKWCCRELYLCISRSDLCADEAKCAAAVCQQDPHLCPGSVSRGSRWSCTFSSSYPPKSLYCSFPTLNCCKLPGGLNAAADFSLTISELSPASTPGILPVIT